MSKRPRSLGGATPVKSPRTPNRRWSMGGTTVKQTPKAAGFKKFLGCQKPILALKYPFLTDHQICCKVKDLWGKLQPEVKGKSTRGRRSTPKKPCPNTQNEKSFRPSRSAERQPDDLGKEDSPRFHQRSTYKTYSEGKSWTLRTPRLEIKNNNGRNITDSTTQHCDVRHEEDVKHTQPFPQPESYPESSWTLMKPTDETHRNFPETSGILRSLEKPKRTSSKVCFIEESVENSDTSSALTKETPSTGYESKEDASDDDPYGSDAERDFHLACLHGSPNKPNNSTPKPERELQPSNHRTLSKSSIDAKTDNRAKKRRFTDGDLQSNIKSRRLEAKNKSFQKSAVYDFDDAGDTFNRLYSTSTKNTTKSKLLGKKTQQASDYSDDGYDSDRDKEFQLASLNGEMPATFDEDLGGIPEATLPEDTVTGHDPNDVNDLRTGLCNGENKEEKDASVYDLFIDSDTDRFVFFSRTNKTRDRTSRNLPNKKSKTALNRRHSKHEAVNENKNRTHKNNKSAHKQKTVAAKMNINEASQPDPKRSKEYPREKKPSMNTSDSRIATRSAVKKLFNERDNLEQSARIEGNLENQTDPCFKTPLWNSVPKLSVKSSSKKSKVDSLSTPLCPSPSSRDMKTPLMFEEFIQATLDQAARAPRKRRPSSEQPHNIPAEKHDSSDRLRVRKNLEPLVGSVAPSAELCNRTNMTDPRLRSNKLQRGTTRTEEAFTSGESSFATFQRAADSRDSLVPDQSKCFKIPDTFTGTHGVRTSRSEKRLESDKLLNQNTGANSTNMKTRENENLYLVTVNTKIGGLMRDSTCYGPYASSSETIVHDFNAHSENGNWSRRLAPPSDTLQQAIRSMQMVTSPMVTTSPCISETSIPNTVLSPALSGISQLSADSVEGTNSTGSIFERDLDELAFEQITNVAHSDVELPNVLRDTHNDSECLTAGAKPSVHLKSREELGRLRSNDSRNKYNTISKSSDGRKVSNSCEGGLSFRSKTVVKAMTDTITNNDKTGDATTPAETKIVRDGRSKERTKNKTRESEKRRGYVRLPDKRESHDNSNKKPLQAQGKSNETKVDENSDSEELFSSPQIPQYSNYKGSSESAEKKESAGGFLCEMFQDISPSQETQQQRLGRRLLASSIHQSEGNFGCLFSQNEGEEDRVFL